MANPSKRFPYAIEAELDGRWYAMEAYRDRAEADAMLPIIQQRAPGTPLRVRDVRDKAEERP